MAPDGARPKNLTNTDRFSKDFGPSFSPDGSKAALTSDRNANNREIYVMDSDGTDQSRLTNNLLIDQEPAFSPSGRQIVFTSQRDGDYEIYKMGAGGILPTNVSNYDAGGNALAAIDFLPDWGRKPIFKQL
jgi:Tol biopolymer transport system component